MEQGAESSQGKCGLTRDNSGEEKRPVVGTGSGSGSIKARVDQLELRSAISEESPHLRQLKMEQALHQFTKPQIEHEDEEEDFDDTQEEMPKDKSTPTTNQVWPTGYRFSIPVSIPLDVDDPFSDICRICHDSDKEERLLSPCRCKGSMSLVHRSCLERWLAEADSTNCELCGHIYNTKRSPKYGLLASVWVWFRSTETRRERREVAFDLLACCAFTPLVIIGTYLGLVMGETLYINEVELDRDNLSGRLATLSVVSLMTTLDLSYVSWLVLRLQYHIGQWYIWYRRNCKVSLLSHGENDRLPISSPHPTEEQPQIDDQLADDPNNSNTQNPQAET